MSWSSGLRGAQLLYTRACRKSLVSRVLSVLQGTDLFDNDSAQTMRKEYDGSVKRLHTIAVSSRSWHDADDAP